MRSLRYIGTVLMLLIAFLQGANAREESDTDYKEQQVDIPGILSSARSVQKGFEAVKEVKADYQTKEHGTIILGTIEGDLHDVGKNLVAMMFRGAGFKVIDLGVDISEKQFIFV